MEIDAKGVYYKDLNDRIRRAVAKGEKNITLINVNGQRYIGAGLKSNGLSIKISGVPGNDLAAFMDGPTVIVSSNAQDAVGNTMSSGKVVIHGDAGDVLGYSIRGGKILVRGDVGYRAGIHMKAYKDLFPAVIVGGTTRDFLGEYMAGGLLVVLGLNEEESQIVGNYVGTGMHGGVMYIRGKLEGYQLGKEVEMREPDERDIKMLEGYLEEYCHDFNLDLNEIMNQEFVKLTPYSHRPYGEIYAY